MNQEKPEDANIERDTCIYHDNKKISISIGNLLIRVCILVLSLMIVIPFALLGILCGLIAWGFGMGYEFITDYMEDAVEKWFDSK